MRYCRNDASDYLELIALLYNPKRAEWVGAYAFEDQIRVAVAYPETLRIDAEALGAGYIDPDPLGECARVHAFPGVAEPGAGYGLCLYVGIAAHAAMLGIGCIASAPSGQGYGPRSPDADAMWQRLLSGQRRAPIAYPTRVCDGCVAADFASFIEAGLVGWLAEPGPYEALLDAAAAQYLASFALAQPRSRNPAVLRRIEQVLLRGALDREVLQRWRRTYASPAMAANPGRLELGRAAEAEAAEHRAALADLLDL